MSLLDKQEVQDICEHTALRARKWSGFICKRASEDTTPLADPGGGTGGSCKVDGTAHCEENYMTQRINFM